ncbi:hypothetical protein Avbf_11264 [Armadillidium vulgare]|nr:hypothetical protein Avbf_11264 [Armadillidium vulgare]
MDIQSCSSFEAKRFIGCPPYSGVSLRLLFTSTFSTHTEFRLLGRILWTVFQVLPLSLERGAALEYPSHCLSGE